MLNKLRKHARDCGFRMKHHSPIKCTFENKDGKKIVVYSAGRKYTVLEVEIVKRKAVHTESANISLAGVKKVFDSYRIESTFKKPVKMEIKKVEKPKEPAKPKAEPKAKAPAKKPVKKTTKKVAPKKTVKKTTKKTVKKKA